MSLAETVTLITLQFTLVTLGLSIYFFFKNRRTSRKLTTTEENYEEVEQTLKLTNETLANKNAKLKNALEKALAAFEEQKLAATKANETAKAAAENASKNDPSQHTKVIKDHLQTLMNETTKRYQMMTGAPEEIFMEPDLPEEERILALRHCFLKLECDSLSSTEDPEEKWKTIEKGISKICSTAFGSPLYNPPPNLAAEEEETNSNTPPLN